MTALRFPSDRASPRHPAHERRGGGGMTTLRFAAAEPLPDILHASDEEAVA